MFTIAGKGHDLVLRDRTDSADTDVGCTTSLHFPVRNDEIEKAVSNYSYSP